MNNVTVNYPVFKVHNLILFYCMMIFIEPTLTYFIVYQDHQEDLDEEPETWIDSKNVSLITQAEFEKLKSPDAKKVNSKYVCCPDLNGEVIYLFFVLFFYTFPI